MKPSFYIKKYNLAKGWSNRIQAKFLKDMEDELKSILQKFNIDDNYHLFTVAVQEMIDKWNGISNKVPYGIPEGLWKYFYASVVVPYRDKLCPTESAKLQAIIDKKLAKKLTR